MYPSANLVMLKIKQLNLSKKEVAIRMGYKNLDKGMHRIHQFIKEGYYNKNVSEKLMRSLEVDELTSEVIELATSQQIELNKRISELEFKINARKSFVPFIYKKTEHNRPSSVFSYIYSNHNMKYIVLDKDIIDLSLKKQFEQISKIIIEDFKVGEGKCPLFGNITGYYYQRDYDTSSEFDTEGRFINEEIKNLKFCLTL